MPNIGSYVSPKVSEQSNYMRASVWKPMKKKSSVQSKRVRRLNGMPAKYVQLLYCISFTTFYSTCQGESSERNEHFIHLYMNALFPFL